MPAALQPPLSFRRRAGAQGNDRIRVRRPLLARTLLARAKPSITGILKSVRSSWKPPLRQRPAPLRVLGHLHTMPKLSQLGRDHLPIEFVVLRDEDADRRLAGNALGRTGMVTAKFLAKGR